MKKISEIRKEKGISQKELATKLGVAQNTLSQWENGVREPNFESVIEICKILNTSLDILLENPTAFNISDDDLIKAKYQSEVSKAFFNLLENLSNEDKEKILSINQSIINNLKDSLKSIKPEELKAFLDADLKKSNNSDDLVQK